MDENGSGARGGRSGETQPDAGRQAASDQEYRWESKPGEDFGPIAPLPPSRTSSTTSPPPGAGFGMPPAPAGADTVRSPAAAPAAQTVSRPRRRIWRPILPVLGVLVVLAGLFGGVLLVLSRQAASSQGESSAQVTPPPALAVASPSASPVAEATPAVAASPVAATGSPVAAVSPAPVLGLGTVVPGTPAIVGSPGATSPPATRATPTAIAQTATPRTSPAASATLPSLIAPPGVRFPTSTPARIIATRTPLPVPTLRPVTVTTPIRTDRNQYKVGEEASVCAQAAFGSSAQISVMQPDGQQRTLGEFQPPADRVCQTVKLDLPGIYVLTLTVKDTAGREIERSATVVTAAR